MRDEAVVPAAFLLFVAGAALWSVLYIHDHVIWSWISGGSFWSSGLATPFVVWWRDRRSAY